MLALMLINYHHFTVIGTSAYAVGALYHYLHKYLCVWGKAPIRIDRKLRETR